MATVKVKFHASTIDGQKGVLYYQIIHKRVVRRISTRHKLFPAEWLSVVPEMACRSDVPAHLLEIWHRVSDDISRIEGIIQRFECGGVGYTSDMIVEAYEASVSAGGFMSFVGGLVAQLKQMGRVRASETYAAAMNSFSRFRGASGDVPLDRVDSQLIMEYESYLRMSGLTTNTTSFYMRNLRAAYNRAVDKELTAQRNPFRHVYTGIGKTVKRAITLNVMRRIKEHDLSDDSAMDYARDIFMFSFYTRGMSFVDMAFLKKTDLCDGMLVYRRRKTHRLLSIKWESPMQEIVDKYDTSGTPYLLPIIGDMTKDLRRQYLTAAHLVNMRLKHLGRMLGVPIPLTTYVARHTWASVARSKNIPLPVISECMGHESERTTRIYLASLDTSLVDNANSEILKSVCGAV